MKNKIIAGINLRLLDSENNAAVPAQETTPVYYDDEGLILAHMRERPEMLMHLSDRLRNDKEFMLLIMHKGVPDIVDFASKDLLKDQDFLLRAVKYNKNTFSVALLKHRDFAFFQNNPELLRAAVEANWNVLFDAFDNSNPINSANRYMELLKRFPRLEDAHKKALDDLWGLIVKTSYPDTIAEYRNTLTALNRLDITARTRIKTLEEAKHIIAQRNNLLSGNIDPNRPLVVILYPKSDETNALDNNAIPKMIEHNNQVLLFETATDSERIAVLKLLADKLPKGIEISLVIGGHGGRDTTTFFVDDPNPQSYRYPQAPLYLLDPFDYANRAFTDPLRRLNIRGGIF